MQHILEDTEVRVTVLKFGHLSSDLLAYGGQDGAVRIVDLDQTCTVRHVSYLTVHSLQLQPCTSELDHYLPVCLVDKYGVGSCQRLYCTGFLGCA